MNILIVYETKTGTTNYVAEVMQSRLEKAGHEVTLHSLKYQGMEPDFAKADVILFGAPTYDDGFLEPVVKEYVTKSSPDLSQLKVAVFGLGNRTYPQFCKAADFLEEWVEKNNGTLLIPSLRLDAFPDNLEPVEKWVEELVSVLK